MHILYIHQHFALPCGATGTRSFEFASRWIENGHKVTVITGHYDIGGLEYSKDVQSVDGIDIIIAGNKYSNQQSFVRRVFSFISFIWFAFWVGLKVRNVDIIYATSTPLTIGIPAMWLKVWKRIPFIFEVRDQWPAIPIEMGYIKNPLLKKFLLWIEKRIYVKSSGIVVLSPGMAEGVINRLGDIQREIIIVPNCCDLDRFRPDIGGHNVRHKHNWEDKFLLVHIGAMGKANGLDFVLDVALELSDQNEIHFVLIGDGSEKQRLRDRIYDENIPNVEILDSIPKKYLPEYFAAVNISLVIFKDNPVLEHNSANKFFDSLASGKPVLLNYSGWQRQVIEEYNAGFGICQASKAEFIEKIKYLYDNKEILKEMGNNARKLAETKFSRDICSKKVLEMLEKINDNK